MKRKSFAVLFAIVLGLWVSGVYAADVATSSNPAVGMAPGDSAGEAGTPATPVSSRDFNADLPFVLQYDFRACLDTCSQKHTACMSKAKGDPTAENRCDDQQRQCTLSCDDKYYGSSPVGVSGLY